MVESLYSLDVTLFRFGNETLSCWAGDVFFPYITEIRNLELVYAVLLIGVMIRFKKRGIVAVLLLFITIAVSDQISSTIIKNAIGRIRPCIELENVRLLIGCGPGKSFPSSHAVNNFAAATLLAFFFRKAMPYLMVFASLQAFSRVYVGVHYPSDIIGGAVIGWGISFLLLKLYEWTSTAIPLLHSFSPSELLKT